MLRELLLPKHAALPSSARVFLTHRPGADGRLGRFADEIARHGVAHILCLLSDAEWTTAGEYRHAVLDGWPGVEHHRCPLRSSIDGSDTVRLRAALESMAERLRHGSRILIHCELGRVRTGAAAVALLVLLGADVDQALQAVRAAGSDPEEDEPDPSLRRFCAGLSANAASE